MRALRVLLALLGCVAVGVLGLAAPSPAAAEEPTALVSITLSSLSPALPARDGTVTVTGTVTNTSKDRLYRLQAIFWRNQAPITSAEGVDQALASESNVPLGARRTASYDDLYTVDQPYLEPGRSVRFTLSAPVADLQLSPTDGVYLMGVHVLQDGRPIAIGRARTFVPVLADEPVGRLKMTSLVVLTSRPSLLRRGVLVDEHLAAEIEPGGRLDELLTAADSDGASFAVDPALIQELTTMADGYLVQNGDGATTTGTGRSDATAWLDRFDDLEDDRDGFRLLFGSPDIAALVHSRQTAVLDAAVAAGQQVSATSSLPLLVLPAGGWADEATVRAAERLDPAAIVLSDASAPGNGPLLKGLGDAPIVRYGSTSSGGGPGPEPSDTAVQVRQRALADSWVEASTATPGSVHGQVRLITATNQLQGEDPAVEAPWLTTGTLSTLLTGQPAAWDEEFVYPPEATDAELTNGQLGSLSTFARRSAAYAELLADPSDVTARAAVARAASANWREHDRSRRLFLAPQQAALAAVLDNGLQISSNPKVSTIAREGVEFPITVRNLLPVDPQDADANTVRLRLVFVSDNPQRLTIKPLDLEPLPAGTNVTENAKVTARANGTVPVRAQLQTTNGTPVGRPLTIDVRVTQNGTTGWAIAAGAAVVFLGGTALRIRRLSRSRAEAAAEQPADVPSALTSAPPVTPPATGDGERLDA